MLPVSETTGDIDGWPWLVRILHGPQSLIELDVTVARRFGAIVPILNPTNFAEPVGYHNLKSITPDSFGLSVRLTNLPRQLVSELYY